MNDQRRTKPQSLREIQSQRKTMEFMILMHETTQERAQMVAERIRCQHRMEMGFHPLSDWQAKPSVIRVTVSIGSTSLHLENDSLPEMLTRADRALYTAKESGRNRVCIQA
jgi:diguanylate cyclase (GGDEF)-like protein